MAHAANNCESLNSHSAGPLLLYAFGIWGELAKFAPINFAANNLGSLHSPFHAAYTTPSKTASDGPALELPLRGWTGDQLPAPFQCETYMPSSFGALSMRQSDLRHFQRVLEEHPYRLPLLILQTGKTLSTGVDPGRAPLHRRCKAVILLFNGSDIRQVWVVGPIELRERHSARLFSVFDTTVAIGAALR